MKTSSAMIVSSIILSIAIILSAYKISSKIYPSDFPSKLTVTNYDGDRDVNNANSSKEFMTLYEAASYLRVDQTKLKELIQNGKLNGTFTSYVIPSGGTEYIFSTSKLSEWMKKAIENGEYLR